MARILSSEEIGQRLRERRGVISMQEVCNATGFSMSNMSCWERGINSIKAIDLMALCDYYHCSPLMFLIEPEDSDDFDLCPPGTSIKEWKLLVALRKLNDLVRPGEYFPQRYGTDLFTYYERHFTELHEKFYCTIRAKTEQPASAVPPAEAPAPAIRMAPIEDRPLCENFRDELPRYQLLRHPDHSHPALPLWYNLACGPGMDLEKTDGVYAIEGPRVGGAQIARIRGDSMMETLRDGDLVVLQPLNGADGISLEPLEPGQEKGPVQRMMALIPHRGIIVCAFNDEPPTCKRILYSTRDNWHALIVADNPAAWEPRIVQRSDRFTIYARVLGLGIQD